MSKTAERERTSRLLLVEDEAAQRHTLTGIMEDEGYEVVGCSTADEALAHIRRGGFGVAVVDLQLPDSSGTQLLEKIEALDDRVRVIINTGYGSFHSAKDAVNLGAFAYVEKAGDPNDLVRQVRRAFHAHLNHYAQGLEVAVAERTRDLAESNKALREEIAERIRADEARRRLEDQLRRAQKLEAVGTLAAGVAHDFNNLLTAIIGYTDLVRRHLPADSEARKLLQGIDQVADQATGVTSALLAFSRHTTSERVPLALGRLVEDSVRMLRRMLPAAIEILTEIPPGGEPWVEGDATQLQQVLLNLVVNARDAMPDGGQLRITVDAEAGQATDAWGVAGPNSVEEAVLRVEDTGTGMSDDVRAQAFDPFFTTKPREQGTGLGLSIIHGIVGEHGGRITINSDPGCGTRVVIRLPCCAPRDEVEPHEAERVSPAVTGHGIILAEDNHYVRTIMASALGAEGYDVVQASDGIEVMTAFAARRDITRLVILDLDLPRKSGLTCLREIRAQAPGMPGILITGNPTCDLDDAKGADTVVLRKPFRMSELTQLAARTLHAPAGVNG